MTADIIEAAQRVCASITEEDIHDLAEHLGGQGHKFSAGMIDLGVAVQTALAASQPAPAAHPDDEAVDRFAAAMKAKLAKKRDEGRGGWWDDAYCNNGELSEMLRHHVEKGDPLDVGNLAMMLHQRGERIAPAADTGQAVAWRGELQEVSDLLAERKHGSPARSPAHNARLIVDRLLKAHPAPLDAERVREMERALEPFARFATKAERFVEGRANNGGSPILPVKDFRLADFQRARAALRQREGNSNG